MDWTYRVAALCSPVWQNRKRTSLRVFVKAYLLDIVADGVWWEDGRWSGKTEERRRRSLFNVLMLQLLDPKSVTRANWGADCKRVASDWPEGSTSVSLRALYLQRATVE